MDAAVEEQGPHNEGAEEIREHALLTDAAQQQGEQDHHHGDCEQPEVDRAAVEERHHQDGNQVVGDREGGQEDLQRHGHLVAEHRENAHGEGDIRGGRDAPAAGGHRAVVDDGVDECRGDDAAERSNHRQHGLLRRGQLSVRHFAPDFQPHGEEEDHHQDVVDELLDRQVAREEHVHIAVRTVEVQLHVRLQYIMIESARKGKVGQQHGHHHAGHEQNTLEPGLLGQTSTAFVEFKNTFVPGVDGDQFHRKKLPLRFAGAKVAFNRIKTNGKAVTVYGS